MLIPRGHPQVFGAEELSHGVDVGALHAEPGRRGVVQLEDAPAQMHGHHGLGDRAQGGVDPALTLAPARKTPRPVVRDSAAPDPSRASESDARADQAEPADELFQTVRSLVTRIASEPMTAAEIARNLAVTAPQVQKWLKRLVDEGVLEKSKKPVRYSLRQTGLFEPSSERPAVTRRRTGRGKR